MINTIVFSAFFSVLIFACILLGRATKIVTKAEFELEKAIKNNNLVEKKIKELENAISNNQQNL